MKKIKLIGILSMLFFIFSCSDESNNLDSIVGNDDNKQDTQQQPTTISDIISSTSTGGVADFTNIEINQNIVIDKSITIKNLDNKSSLNYKITIKSDGVILDNVKNVDVEIISKDSADYKTFTCNNLGEGIYEISNGGTVLFKNCSLNNVQTAINNLICNFEGDNTITNFTCDSFDVVIRQNDFTRKCPIIQNFNSTNAAGSNVKFYDAQIDTIKTPIQYTDGIYQDDPIFFIMSNNVEINDIYYINNSNRTSDLDGNFDIYVLDGVDFNAPFGSKKVTVSNAQILETRYSQTAATPDKYYHKDFTDIDMPQEDVLLPIHKNDGSTSVLTGSTLKHITLKEPQSYNIAPNIDFKIPFGRYVAYEQNRVGFYLTTKPYIDIKGPFRLKVEFQMASRTDRVPYLKIKDKIFTGGYKLGDDVTKVVIEGYYEGNDVQRVYLNISSLKRDAAIYTHDIKINKLDYIDDYISEDIIINATQDDVEQKVISLDTYNGINENTKIRLNYSSEETTMNSESLLSKIALNFPIKTIDLTNCTNLATVRDKLFYNAQTLEEIIFPDCIKKIDTEAFGYNPKLRKINIPRNCNTFNANNLVACPLIQEINIADENPYFKIDEQGFIWNTSGTYQVGEYLVSIPIQSDAETIVLPSTIKNIQDSAFRRYYLKNIDLSNLDFENMMITNFGGSAFGNTQLEIINIPEGITGLMKQSFNGVKTLKEVHLPSTLIDIGSKAFNGTNVEKIYYNGSQEDWLNNVTVASDSAFNERALIFLK